jgi:hypothetical protein
MAKLPHDFDHKQFVVVPGDFSIDPANIKFPPEMTYTIHHFATHKVTGDRFMLITSENQAGLKDFADHFPTSKKLGNGKLPGNRAEWIVVVFPTLDDGISDPEDIFRKGLDFMNRRKEDRDRQRQFHEGLQLRG